MKIVRWLFLTLFVIGTILLVVGFFLPRNYKVERSITIKAPIELIFDQVIDLKKNEAWSPWKDSTMIITYGPMTSGVGASSSWTSESMGIGSQTIEESVSNKSIQTYLDFGNMGTATVNWKFLAIDSIVKVTQSMSGDQGVNPVKRYFGLMMDKFIGPFFEKGLASLKQVSESNPIKQGLKTTPKSKKVDPKVPTTVNLVEP